MRRLDAARLSRLLVHGVIALVGAAVLVRLDIAERREAFQADARIAHRLLSQRAAENDAILATLALLAPTAAPPALQAAARRLPGLYPQVVAAQVRDGAEAWPHPALAEAESRALALPPLRRHAVVGSLDTAAGRYALVLPGAAGASAAPGAFALHIDLHRMATPEGWPLPRDGPARATLVLGADTVLLAPGAEAAAAAAPAGLTAGFTFSKVLATPSQPFELRVQRRTGPADWPWVALSAWLLGNALVATLLAAWRRARRERERAAELTRLSQVSRLNLMGELAAGMAHELNQPLTAVLAGTQTAQRVLGPAGQALDEDAELDTARSALALAAAQARRAADVLARLRRLVERPHGGQPRSAVDLREATTRLLALMEPQLRRHGIAVQLLGQAPPVRADAVALEQILHNLLTNALQALEAADAPGKAITVRIAAGADRAGMARLEVRDNGPGIPPDVLPRVFEPFFTRRAGGLGLGLPLCETLALAMDGRLGAANDPAGGALFTLELPLADADTPAHSEPEPRPTP
ncbi:sensor histidine kinase [Azohydromonas aeria]|uniref:sensor histidine kinase n=1 Tax=Azohydromonas aeria TaxID=2590212 RepID=UPI0012FB3F9C|nr:ATP-binding protein [Azohydromonas aeria]